MLGCHYPLVELCLEPLMQIVGFTRLLLARGAGNGLGAASRVRKRLFVARLRGVRPLFQLLRRCEIVTMTLLRAAMMPPMRGSAILDIST